MKPIQSSRVHLVVRGVHAISIDHSLASGRHALNQSHQVRLIHPDPGLEGFGNGAAVSEVSNLAVLFDLRLEHVPGDSHEIEVGRGGRQLENLHVLVLEFGSDGSVGVLNGTVFHAELGVVWLLLDPVADGGENLFRVVLGVDGAPAWVPKDTGTLALEAGEGGPEGVAALEMSIVGNDASRVACLGDGAGDVDSSMRPSHDASLTRPNDGLPLLDSPVDVFLSPVESSLAEWFDDGGSNEGGISLVPGFAQRISDNSWLALPSKGGGKSVVLHAASVSGTQDVGKDDEELGLVKGRESAPDGIGLGHGASLCDQHCVLRLTGGKVEEDGNAAVVPSSRAKEKALSLLLCSDGLAGCQQVVVSAKLGRHRVQLAVLTTMLLEDLLRGRRAVEDTRSESRIVSLTLSMAERVNGELVGTVLELSDGDAEEIRGQRAVDVDVDGRIVSHLEAIG